MKYYLAPLEGITNVYFRQALDKHYGKLDKYYIPFLAPKDRTLHTKELRETEPTSNKLTGKVVPQIISKNSEDTIWLINYLNEQGYDEINLNFGCPSGTVVAKGKGAGMLADIDYMDKYLKDLFDNTTCKISIKIRLGLEDIKEFDNILNVINKYPVHELIIHPRTAKQKYSGKLYLDAFEGLNNKTNIDIIYNGEIKSIEDISYIEQRFSFVKGVMIGRGLITYPDMLTVFKNDKERLEKLKAYYYDFSLENIMVFGWNNSKFFHKEIWAYLINYFDCPKQLSKKLFKANKEDEFKDIVEEIFNTCSISKNIPSIKDYL